MEDRRDARLAARPALWGIAHLLLALILLVPLLAQAQPPAPPITCPPPGGTICSGIGGGGGNPGGPGGPGDPGGGSPPPGGGGEDPPPSGGGEGCMDYRYCVDFYLCDELADLVTDNCTMGGDWLLDYSCRSLDSCTAPSNPPTEGPPCDPVSGGGGWSWTCDGWWGYFINVLTVVPPHRVLRAPFPRGLVSVPNTFTLLPDPAYSTAGGPNGPGGEGGFWSDGANIPNPRRADPQPGDVKDLQIGLRWRRLHTGESVGGQTIPRTCWLFDERSWNLGQDYGYGPVSSSACDSVVQHVYETASYDLPANGPRYDSATGEVGPWDLESYQVSVPTYWAGEWNIRWWSWDEVGTEWGDCFCRAEGEPLGVPHSSCGASNPACGGCSGWCGKLGEPRYEWVKHEEGWQIYDLRQNGLSTWYYVSTSVVPGGLFEGVEYWGPAMGSVPAPIVEVQSVIREP